MRSRDGKRNILAVPFLALHIARIVEEDLLDAFPEIVRKGAQACRGLFIVEVLARGVRCRVGGLSSRWRLTAGAVGEELG